MKPRYSTCAEAAETVAIQALTYLAGDPERLDAIPCSYRPRSRLDPGRRDAAGVPRRRP